MNDNNLVTQSNSLVDAHYQEPLTARQQKIVLSIVSKIQIDDEDFKLYEVRIRDFNDMLGLKGEPKYTELKNVTEDILKKTLKITREKGRLLQVSWFSSIEYFENEGRIEFSFDPKLKPYLLDLKKAFTSYRLSNILSLNSGYAIRLYELMKKWQNVGKWECTVDNMKELLGISKEKYKQYGHFKNRIMVPSIEDLNKKTDVRITFSEIKEGRKVSKLSFKIQHLKEKEIKIKKPNLKDNQDSLFIKLNKSARNFEITLSVYNFIKKIAKEIYEEEAIEKELDALVKLTNKNSKESSLGFMIHIMKEKQKLYIDGENPSIIDVEMRSSEVIPDWYPDRNKPKEKKTKEQLAIEEAEIKEIDALLAEYKTGKL